MHVTSRCSISPSDSKAARLRPRRPRCARRCAQRVRGRPGDGPAEENGSVCPVRANWAHTAGATGDPCDEADAKRFMHCSKLHPYSITSSAWLLD